MNDRDYFCCECYQQIEHADVLRGPHPFSPGEEMLGCPRCRGTDLAVVCDEPGCRLTVTCGTPTSDGGYRNTCSAHCPKE